MVTEKTIAKRIYSQLSKSKQFEPSCTIRVNGLEYHAVKYANEPYPFVHNVYNGEIVFEDRSNNVDEIEEELAMFYDKNI